MAARILHVLDPTTSADAVEALALFLHAERTASPDVTHELAVLGHRSTHNLLTAAGLGADAGTAAPAITWIRSMGWADPTSWRALRQTLQRKRPTRLHAWGATAAMACAMVAPGAGRVVTLTQPSARIGPRILKAIDTGKVGKMGWPRRSARPVQWVALSQDVINPLLAAGISRERIAYVPQAVATTRPTASDSQWVREELGLLPQDGPLFLLGGDASGRSRHDYGLWAGGIVQQIVPGVRIIIREDPRRRRNHGLERLIDALADPAMCMLAPAEMSWASLVSVADVVLIPADGPVEMGAALHAMAAGVPVVGTPVPAVQEVIEDRRTGLIAPSLKPRALAARIEELLSDPALRQALVSAAHEEMLTRRSPMAMVDAFRNIYAQGITAAIP